MSVVVRAVSSHMSRQMPTSRFMQFMLADPAERVGGLLRELGASIADVEISVSTECRLWPKAVIFTDARFIALLTEAFVSVRCASTTSVTQYLGSVES